MNKSLGLTRAIMTGRSYLMLILLCATSPAVALGQTAEPPSPQVTWHPGPARVNLRLPMVSIDIPANLHYVDDPNEIAAVSKYWDDETIRNALAMIAPEDMSWFVFVLNDPAGIEDDGGESLVSPARRDKLFKRFQTLAYQISQKLQAMGRPTFRNIGWAAEPTYARGDRRSLLLPFLQLYSTGEEQVQVYGWVANSKSCVHFTSSIPKDQASTVIPQVRLIMDSVVLPFVPEAERPKPAANPIQPVTWVEKFIKQHTFENIGTVVALLIAVVLSLIGWLWELIRSRRSKQGEQPDESPRIEHPPRSAAKPPAPPPAGLFADD